MKKNMFPSLLLVFCFLFLVLSGEGIAGTLQDTMRRGKLIAGVKTEYAPLGFLDRKGNNTGFDVDISRALAKELFGKEGAIEFVPVLPENQITFLTSEQIDIIVGISPTEEREKKIDFSIPYFISGQSILVREDSKITKYKDLAGKRVAIIRGSRGDTAISELVPAAERINFEHPSKAVQALKEHRVEAFVENYVSLYRILQQNRGLRIADLAPFSPAPLCIGLRKGDNEWLNFLNATLEKMKSTGGYEKLLDKWFGLQARALRRLFEK